MQNEMKPVEPAYGMTQAYVDRVASVKNDAKKKAS
jgi:hypothetical protein